MTPDDFASGVNVSRETLDRLLAMDAKLLEWSRHTNLVAPSTLPSRWSRHYLDSAQLAPLIPKGAGSLVDLGSGAGFPGLVLAAMFEDEGPSVTMIEATGKKAAFLREAIDAMRLAHARVVHARIEDASFDAPPDVVTARALAPMPKLLALAAAIGGPDTAYFFPKGLKGEAERDEAARSWRMTARTHASRTSRDAQIYEIRKLARVP